MAAEIRLSSVWVTVLLALTAGSIARAQDSVEPAESLVGKNEKNLQRVLIGPMEPGDAIGRGGWRMKSPLVEAAEGMQPKVGRGALVFGAEAEVAGAKGDFTVHGQLPGRTEALGLWVYLDENANIEKLGVQVSDAQDEALLMLAPADWTGWKWIEFAEALKALDKAISLEKFKDAKERHEPKRKLLLEALGKGKR